MWVQEFDRTAEVIKKVIDQTQADLPKDDAQQINAFLQQYYLRVSPDDLLERDIIDLRGAALAHWHMGRKRAAGENKIRIYNPRFEKHGWQSTHTIVEIIADDMPFLVDSVSMALNRHGLTIHLTIHPVMAVLRDNSGKLLEVQMGRVGDGGAPESYMHFEVDKFAEPEVLDGLVEEIAQVLVDVRKATQDWRPMRKRCSRFYPS